MYILLNETNEVSVISDVENTESVTSVGGAENETVSATETKEWPKGGVDAFKNEALPSLIFGMLGIFMVLGLIALATMALNKLFPGKKD